MSHAAIMDAIYELLEEKPARELTMEAVANRANVGKPTLYKWWSFKAALNAGQGAANGPEPMNSSCIENNPAIPTQVDAPQKIGGHVASGNVRRSGVNSRDRTA